MSDFFYGFKWWYVPIYLFVAFQIILIIWEVLKLISFAINFDNHQKLKKLETKKSKFKGAI